jgi:hypothetical protein
VLLEIDFINPQQSLSKCKSPTAADVDDTVLEWLFCMVDAGEP